MRLAALGLPFSIAFVEPYVTGTEKWERGRRGQSETHVPQRGVLQWDREDRPLRVGTVKSVHCDPRLQVQTRLNRAAIFVFRRLRRNSILNAKANSPREVSIKILSSRLQTAGLIERRFARGT